MVVPATFPEFTTRRVLTTGWLDGEKLSQSKADDVAQLVNLGVVCYLKQLLDTGFFHVCPSESPGLAPYGMVSRPIRQSASLPAAQGTSRVVDPCMRNGLHSFH